MKEQNENEKDKKKSWWKGEKKFYLFTAIGCAAVLLAVIIVAVAVSANQVEQGAQNPPSNSVVVPNTGNNGNKEPEQNKPVDGEVEGMVMPLVSVSVSNDYGFWYNQTLNCYYEHQGMDFVAEAGTQVLAVESGVVESIYKEDILCGTEIVVNHGNGLKSLYRFVNEATGLKVGDSVSKGQVIATVAEANGEEYKDGAHLHFELVKNGVNIDPATQLTLEEK